jgi:hypothetical protein
MSAMEDEPPFNVEAGEERLRKQVQTRVAEEGLDCEKGGEGEVVDV